MKTNYWLILGTLLATGAMAQVNTNKLPEIPAPANATPAPAPVVKPTNAPAPAKKAAVVTPKAVKKISEPTVALTAGPATVISENLNLRGQAGLKGEVVGHAKKGETVTVLSQINLDKHAADEPAQWAKIVLPVGTKVWINAHFVDKANKTVTAKKLNFRAGPGENYSVLGVLEKGAAYNELSAKDEWIQIEAPANAYAFVAAMYLKQEAPAPVVAANPPPAVVETPAPVPAPVATPAPTPVVKPPAEPAAPTPTPAAIATPAPAVETSNAVAIVETNLPPPPPRVVSHEGYVRHSISPVAPTYYELFDWDTGNAINYLYSPSTNLNIARYNGYKIIVTGEEGMAPRWKATPVLTIQKIYVTATNYPSSGNLPATSPRGSQDNYRAIKRR